MLAVDYRLGERTDIVPFLEPEDLVEICCPADIGTVMVLRHCGLVHERELHRLAEMVTDIFLVFLVRPSDELFGRPLFDDRRIVSASCPVGGCPEFKRLRSVAIPKKTFLEFAFPVGGGNLPTRPSGRPTAFIVEPYVHAEGCGMFHDIREYEEILLRKIIWRHFGIKCAWAEILRERMDAQTAHSVRQHVVNLRIQLRWIEL